MKKPELVNLENICTKIIDCPHSTPNWLEKGIPIIRNYNLVNGHVNTQNLSYVDKKTYLERIKRAKPEQGDIVISREAPMGAAGMIPPNFNCCLGQRVVLLKLDKEKVDPYYFLYAFQSFLVQKQISQINKTGSIVSNLNIKDLRKLKIPIIDLKKQEIIVKLLKKIDSKITNNNAISKELASMAKTIYDYWFLQFEFPDKDSKPYKSNGGKMVWNDQLKQEIPEGWEVDNLYRIAKFINGIACQKYRPLDDKHKLPVIKITEMHDGYTENTEFVRDSISKDHIINDGDILFSWSASLETMIWNNGKGGLNQHIFKVIPQDYFSQHFVYQTLSSYIVNFKRMAEARKTTMGHITKDHLKQSRIMIPPKHVINKFESLVNNFYKEITNLNEENQQLKSLRDFLLPLLVNGQVKIKG